MNFNEILIRMAVDAKAVVSGLNQITAFTKAWAGQLREEIGRAFIGMFAAGAAIEWANKIKEEVLEISRLSEELGTSTNFIQSLQLKAQQMGVGIESLTRPFVVFNRQIGEAKRGIPDAVEKLSDMGIITDKNQLSTLTYTEALRNLKIQYDKIGDTAKQDALLNEAFGNSAYRVAFIFRQTQAQFDAMNQGNFFTKFTPETITTLQSNWNAIKAVLYGFGASLTNTYGFLEKGTEIFLHWMLQPLAQGPLKGLQNAIRITNEQYTQLDIQKQSAAQMQQDIQVEEQRASILEQQISLLERQTELTAEIADRGKTTIADMAEQARRLLGLPEPKLYGVSNRMREALRIDTLERRATIAFEKGDDSTFQKLRSEADQLRQASPWAKLQDRNPMERAESELSRVNEQLKPVAEMAQLVTGEHKIPQ